MDAAWAAGRWNIGHCGHRPSDRRQPFVAISGVILRPHLAVAVAFLASQGLGFLRRSWSRHALLSLLALTGGFLLYQGTIALVYPVIVDGHTLGADVITGLLLQQLIWGGALALGHCLWLRLKITQNASIRPTKSPGEPGL